MYEMLVVLVFEPSNNHVGTPGAKPTRSGEPTNA